MPNKPRRTTDPSRDPADPAPRQHELSDDPQKDGLPADTTWDPAEADPFEDDEFLDDGSIQTPDPHAVPADTPPVPGPGPGVTREPSRTWGIADVWNDDFEDFSPSMTLKEPGARRRPSRFIAEFQRHRLTDVKVEGYDLLDVLGEGGVGVVYQALQKSIDRKIAVKMVKSDSTLDAKDKAKFITEAIVTGDLDHPNIVPIHDLGETADGRPFYVMKLVKGTPWSDLIRDKSLEENLQILLDVCDAVSFAHSKGIIHRDLKPENVMLGEFGEVQVMDWGLGLSVTDTGKATPVSATHAAGGTPSYMAPEMVTGEQDAVGIHSDVYLLGAILYEILTGSPPHAGTRIMDTLQNALDNVIAPTNRSGVLVDIARKAMQTRPADRHPSVKAFKQALCEYQSNAESIKLAQRSAEDRQQAHATQDYELFAQALFGFRNALKLWSENAEARDGVVQTQLAYARCALAKGDYDLAASLLDPSDAVHRELAAEVAAAQHRRAGARRRLRRLRAAALGLSAAVMIILAVASAWIARARQREIHAKEAALAAKQRAVAARNDALVAQHAEAQQRQRAETAMVKAQEEEARAVQALADLERAVQALVQAQTQEERALAKARAAELVAAETRDELARSGMLMDNSWWVFGPEEAVRRQRAAAKALKMPVDLTVMLANDVPLELVLIPPGEFVMGSPPSETHRAADEYLHRAHITCAFYVGKYELTEAQWRALTGSLPGENPQRSPVPQRPVVGPGLAAIEQQLLPALQTCAPDGWRFRLPTEAEWEYACRAGTPTAYCAGDDEAHLAAAGWYLSNSDRTVQPVGGKTPNAFGLYDLHGNVGEICRDRYAAGFYLESPTNDPCNTAAGDTLVVRGGSVFNTAAHCRSAYRSYLYRKNQYEFLGLRLALVPIGESAGANRR